MYYDFQDASTEGNHVRASSSIFPKVALAVTIVSHCMCLLSPLACNGHDVALQVYITSVMWHQRRRVGTITVRVLLFNRGGNDVLHEARSASCGAQDR